MKKNIRILFLSDNFFPEVNAPASRTLEHCREWVQQGAKVTVITCFPNFPQGRVFAGYKNHFCKVEQIEGIRVIRVWSFITGNKGFLKRIIDYMSFALTSFIAGLFLKTDIIVATSPQFFTTWSGYLLSKVKNKPWVFELRDIWPESIKTVGAMKSSLLLAVLEKIELGLYRDSQKVITVTKSFKKNLENRGIRSEKIEIITNGADLQLFDPAQVQGDQIRHNLNLTNKFVVGYIGTHGMAHGLDFILNSIKQLQDPKMHFIFIGDGAMKEPLKRLASELKLDNVTFIDPISRKQVSEYIAAMDVALIPLRKSDTFKEVIPSKIFESASMEKPILLGVDGEARQIIETYNCGLYFEPEDKESFLKTLERIRQPEIYDALKANSKKLAHDYDRRTLARQMLGILSEI